MRLFCPRKGPCHVPPTCGLAAQSHFRHQHSRARAVAPSLSITTPIDVNEYVSGKIDSTLLGKVIQGVFPAPLRFTVSWLPPILAIASCHANAIISLMAACAAVVQAHLPILQPVLHIGSNPVFLLIASAIMNSLPLVFAFVAVPILDWALGEEDAQALGAPTSRWQAMLYNGICYGFVALHMAALVNTAYVASLPGTSLAHVALLCLNQAVVGGYAITVSHELSHRSNKIDRFLGQALLTSCCYRHWGHSHKAHHAHVATEDDPASARYHEAVYPFMLRCISGEWRDAVNLEMQQVRRDFPNLSATQQLLRSRIPGWIGWPTITGLAFNAVFGPAGLAAYACSGFGSVLFLTAINYVEHYGLTRKRLPCGRYEQVSAHHSWNANHLVSNASLLRLQRHTDHHMHAHKPFYQLENVEGAPRLPADYSTMVLLALVPPAWFCVMNPRVHMYKLLSESALA